MFSLLPECNFTFSTKTTSQPHCKQRGLQKVLKISDEYGLTTPASDRLIRHRLARSFFCTLGQLTCKSGVKKGVVCIEFAREKRKKRSTMTTSQDLFVCLFVFARNLSETVTKLKEKVQLNFIFTRFL